MTPEEKISLSMDVWLAGSLKEFTPEQQAEFLGREESDDEWEYELDELIELYDFHRALEKEHHSNLERDGAFWERKFGNAANTPLGRVLRLTETAWFTRDKKLFAELGVITAYAILSRDKDLFRQLNQVVKRKSKGVNVSELTIRDLHLEGQTEKTKAANRLDTVFPLALIEITNRRIMRECGEDDDTRAKISHGKMIEVLRKLGIQTNDEAVSVKANFTKTRITRGEIMLAIRRFGTEISDEEISRQFKKIKEFHSLKDFEFEKLVTG